MVIQLNHNRHYFDNLLYTIMTFYISNKKKQEKYFDIFRKIITFAPKYRIHDIHLYLIKRAKV